MNPEFQTGFAYSDCWVEDSRLVVLNALDAAQRGATIRLHTRIIGARPQANVWQVQLRRRDGNTEERFARILVNAAGPWVEQVLQNILGANEAAKVRLVKGSHLVVRRPWSGEHAYILQNPDRRIVFLIPFEQNLAILGTTDLSYMGPPEAVACTAAERDYLLAAANRYLRRNLVVSDIVYEYAGVRSLFDDNAADPSAVTRDYVLSLHGDKGNPPLLSVFGGKITTFRRLAEHAMARLAPFLPNLGPAFTRNACLPGGDIAGGDFSSFLRELTARFSFLCPELVRHYARLYGTRAFALLEGAHGARDLGKRFGGQFYEREADFLVRTEWAETTEDILFRRTRHHLHLTSAEQEDFARWMAKT